MFTLNIALWKKDSGNYLSPKSGLTKEQVLAFRALKEGDRLIAYASDTKFTDKSPDLVLKTVRSKPQTVATEAVESDVLSSDL